MPRMKLGGGKILFHLEWPNVLTQGLPPKNSQPGAALRSGTIREGLEDSLQKLYIYRSLTILQQGGLKELHSNKGPASINQLLLWSLWIVHELLIEGYRFVYSYLQFYLIYLIFCRHWTLPLPAENQQT